MWNTAMQAEVYLLIVPLTYHQYSWLKLTRNISTAECSWWQ